MISKNMEFQSALRVIEQIACIAAYYPINDIDLRAELMKIDTIIYEYRKVIIKMMEEEEKDYEFFTKK